MAVLEVIEGFDHTDSAAVDMSLLNDKSAGGAGGWIGDLTDTGVTPVTGRDGSGLAMRFASAEVTAEILYQLSADLIDTGSVGVLSGGFAVRLNFTPAEAGEPINLFHCVAVGGVTEGGIAITRSGALVCFRDRLSDGRTYMYAGVAGAAKPIIRNGTWHYVSFVFNIGQSSTSNGGWQVWLDRQLCVDSISGQVAWATGNDLQTVGFFKNVSTGSYDIDDFWLAQMPDKKDEADQNPGPNQYSIRSGVIKDPQVRILFPTGDSATVDWTPEAGTHFSSVDDDPDDGDSTYIDSSAAANVDLFTFPGLGADVVKIPASAVSFTSRETVATGFSVSARTVHAANAATTGTAVDTSANSTFEAKQARARRSVGATPSDLPVTFTNSGAESAVDPPTGWTAVGDVTDEQGAQNTGTPPDGQGGGSTWWFYFDGGSGLLSNESLFLEQEITTVSDSIPDTDIDAGNLQLEFTGFVWDSSGDEGHLELEFKDAGGVTLASFRSPVYNPEAAWTTETFIAHVPPGTRSVAYRMGGQAGGAGQVGIFWDTMSAVYAYLDNLDEFTPTQADAAEFGVITA
jgi:hypothetical protein